jgi:hypothetical protein
MTYRILPILLIAGFGLAACDAGPEVQARTSGAAELAAVDADMIVYKTPTCGCCGLWVDHIEENGFSVHSVTVAGYHELVEKKNEHGVDWDLGSCHTTLVSGYVVEGHVPAHVIRRLLDERPGIRGIAVPGMPIGSPGMEGPNPEPYQVIAIGHDGSRSLFETVDPR